MFLLFSRKKNDFLTSIPISVDCSSAAERMLVLPKNYSAGLMKVFESSPSRYPVKSRLWDDLVDTQGGGWAILGRM